jgi:mRNA-degrading endonuclease toxin of MazEF toxin-antitoxin module
LPVGAILCDQLKSLDWRARRATPLGSVPDAVMQEVTARMLALADPEE